MYNDLCDGGGGSECCERDMDGRTNFDLHFFFRPLIITFFNLGWKNIVFFLSAQFLFNF